MEYVIGRGNWIESIAVGVIGSLAMIVGIVILVPIMIMGSISVLILGITGFLKRKS